MLHLSAKAAVNRPLYNIKMSYKQQNKNNRKRNNKKTPRRGNNASNPGPRNSIGNGVNTVHTFQRCCSMPLQIGINGIIPAVGIVAFINFSIWFTNQTAFIWGNSSNYSASSVPGYTDLAALFDEVMIERVEIEIYSTNLESLTNTGSAVMLLISDFNDHNAPANASDVLQYKDCKCVPLLSRFPYKETVSPMMLSYTLDSAGVSQPSHPIRGFIRSNLDVEHNCRKGSFLTVPNTTLIHTVLFRYTYKCKIVK